jgi:hypothetical protein
MQISKKKSKILPPSIEGCRRFVKILATSFYEHRLHRYHDKDIIPEESCRQIMFLLSDGKATCTILIFSSMPIVRSDKSYETAGMLKVKGRIGTMVL